MYNFLLNIITFVSLGVIVFLLARALPRVNDAQTAEPRGHNQLDKLLAKLPVEKADAVFGAFTEKFLRKTKVLILKIDNFIQSKLSRLRKNGRSDQPLPFDQAAKSDDSKEKPGM